ncbi:hypothetical protein SKAU_G00333250 [Synaphobranchus kaupii]|uniref:Ig-like domain-containing protein n=1 Tax=Synaphobranchus kaupii TaxID=118154 RepID=A0A9Q1ELM5_SYNKA|nr:hypothetical protein SKAU_G00333250 [Synaphobranchus kaupii]
MNQHLLPVVAVIVSAVLPHAVRSQDPVPIRFQTAPVLTASGTEAVLTVVTVPQVFTMTWESPSKETLGLWVTNGPQVNPVAQYLGRLTITSTQLRIAALQLRDSGNYTVTVDPIATTGQGPNSRSVELRVFDAVADVRLSLPSVAIEGGRGDAGDYSCTVSNLVSAQTTTATLTVFYGPDTPRLDQELQADCVGGGQAVVGQTVRLTCESDSLPPALFSWQHNGVPVASGQPDSGVLSVQTFSTNQSGRYVCTARNAITGRTSEQGTDVSVVRTCLSGGAVAGIVIGCILALILIIIAIFLLLRWRKVDQSIRRATGNHNPDEHTQRHSPPLQPALPLPRNHAVPLGHGRPGDHRLQDLNTLHHNGYALPPQNGYHDVTMPQHHHQGNGNALQHNGQPNTNAYPPNGTVHADTFPHNGWQNPNAPQRGAHNPTSNDARRPGDLVQTGYSHPVNPAPAGRRNANTQTYRPDSNPRPGRDPAAPRPRGDQERDRSQTRGVQMPWDRIRGTPAYPNHGFQGDSGTSIDGAERRRHKRDEPGRSDPGRPPPDSAHNGQRRPPVETQTAGRSARERAQTLPPNPDPSTPPPPYNQPVSLAPVYPQNQTARQIRFAPQDQDVQRLTVSRGADRQPTGQPFPSGHTQAATHNAQQQGPQTLQTPNVVMHPGARNSDPRSRPLAQNQGNQQQQGTPLARQPAVLAPGQSAPNHQAPPTAAPNPSHLTQSALQAHTRTHNPFPSRNHQTAAALAQPRPPNAGTPPTRIDRGTPNTPPDPRLTDSPAPRDTTATLTRTPPPPRTGSQPTRDSRPPGTERDTEREERTVMLPDCLPRRVCQGGREERASQANAPVVGMKLFPTAAGNPETVCRDRRFPSVIRIYC